jgi:lipopolysaccharide/colanic/teichoic acid biosynthesis glycosyltransferase
MTYDSRPVSASRSASLFAKRAIDCVAAGVGLMALAPVMLPIALLIRLESEGPVLFRQTREGHGGKPFSVYKFRSMVQNAEQRAGGVVTRLDSPMVTRFGRFLRTSSLDELPQLINVLKGEMSLVGPRPLLPGSVSAGEMRRQDMRPGCTGLVVVRGRQLLDWDERMQIDLWYVDNWSLRLDLEILLKTVPVALLRQGVYDVHGEMKTRPRATVSSAVN